MQRANSFIAAVYHATARYAETRYRSEECETGGSGKLSPRSGKFSHL